MVDRRNCTFCGNGIEPGTGKMYIRIDGSVFYFDRHKCFVNFVELKRVPRETRWSSLSSSASKWKDREKKSRPAVAKKYVPKDLASRLKREEQRRHAEEAGEKHTEQAPETPEAPAEQTVSAAADSEEKKEQ